jgi:tetratricopeptide (TPR) repeat protein
VRPISTCALVLLLAVASVRPGRADDGDNRAAAAAHYTRGIELATQGLYEAALEQFKQAYAKSPHFAVLYNVGQAQIALGRPLEAIEALSTYLREGADKVPLSRREQVQAQIALLETKLAELTIASDTPGAAVRVDDRDVGRTPLFQPIRLAAGTHKIPASLPDGPRITRVVTLAEAERQRLELALAGEAPPSRPAVTALPADAPEASASDTPAPLVSLARGPEASSDTAAAPVVSMLRLAYVSTAVGVAAAGAALGIYLWNRGRYDDWRAGQAALDELTRGSAAYRTQAVANNDLASSLTTANHTILGLSVASGVLVATGASLFLVDRARGRNAAGELSFSWTGSSAQLGWSGRW